MKDNLKNEYNAAFDLIDRNLKNYAEKIAFVDDNTSITYKELFINIQKVSHILLDLGLKKGDTVLDNCMGVGSTGIASKKYNRNFIGIELDETYYKQAIEFIQKQE